MRATVLLILSSFAATFGYRKSATLTPLNSTVDGATVNLLRDTTVNSNSDAWEIACTDTNRYWAIEISLDSTWGFHASLPSNITLRVNSDTPTEKNTDLIISFSVNRAQYWSTMLNADGRTESSTQSWNNFIGPQCDTNTPPQSASRLYTGDIKAYVEVSNNGGRWTSSGATIDNWQPPSNSIYFPFQFKIENVPADNLMYVYNIQETYTQKCGFAEAFAGEQGLQIYLHLDDAGEFLSVQSFELQYEDGRTDDPSTANPTTIRPTTSDPTSNPTIPPSTDPSEHPTDYPSSLPTIGPSFAPSQYPTNHPSPFTPTVAPTNAPELLLFSTTDPQEREHSSTIAIKDTDTASATTPAKGAIDSQHRQGSDEDSDLAIGKQTQTADISTMVIAVGSCIGVCLPVFICALVYKYWTIMKESSALEHQHVEHDMNARGQKGADRDAVVAAPPNTVDIQLASQGVELQECVQEGQRKSANATRKMSEGPKPTSEGVADSVRSQDASSMFKVTSNPLAGDVTVYYNMNAENDEEVIDEEEDAGKHGHTTR